MFLYSIDDTMRNLQNNIRHAGGTIYKMVKLG